MTRLGKGRSTFDTGQRAETKMGIGTAVWGRILGGFSLWISESSRRAWKENRKAGSSLMRLDEVEAHKVSHSNRYSQQWGLDTFSSREENCFKSIGDDLAMERWKLRFVSSSSNFPRSQHLRKDERRQRPMVTSRQRWPIGELGDVRWILLFHPKRWRFLLNCPGCQK